MTLLQVVLVKGDKQASIKHNMNYMKIFKGDKQASIKHNMNYMKIFKYSIEDSSPHVNYKKIIYSQIVLIVNLSAM